LKLQNIGGHKNIYDYVSEKLQNFSKTEISFKTLFDQMFLQSNNVMCETSDGFRIKKYTYEECKRRTYFVAKNLSDKLCGTPKDSTIGLYMSNGLEWILTFWAILMCGYNPLLLNARIADSELEKIIVKYSVKAVVSDSKPFSVLTIDSKELFSLESEPFIAGEFGSKVLFMSSGTTENVKLCAYTAENFFYQVNDSFAIIKNCPQMKEHYDGELKILALLPFYHVFGFIAVYLWFGFFSRTLVFLKDLTAEALLMTVRKHKVTHIFAVPLIWEKIYEQVKNTVRLRGDNTYKKFEKALALTSKREKLGNLVSKVAFKEIRENLFGDSIKFLISGGSAIKSEVLSFFNGIGYHMANGYGMTEIGISAVETSNKRKTRNLGSVGAPFDNTKFSLSDTGELLVKGKTMASYIYQDGVEYKTDFDKWFNTKDLASVKDGKFYILGRRDDLIVCENGENLNPEIIEDKIKGKYVEKSCLISGKENQPTLIVSISGWISSETISDVRKSVYQSLKQAKVFEVVKKVELTFDKLLLDGEFKVSRKKIKNRYLNGQIKIVDEQTVKTEEIKGELEREIAELFRSVLSNGCEISPTSDFFIDLGGNSLDYFTLLSLISDKFSINKETLQSWGETTVRGFATRIEK
jgi:long-subunit acyl-CoA synthetase (AMP-forming)